MQRLAPMWRMRGVFSALLSLSLSAVAAVAWTPVTTAAPGYHTGPTPGASTPLSWGSCSQVIKNSGDVPSAQCGVVAVPVDYANPTGAQVQLAVIRVPATGPRIGALLINPGGPGASAVHMRAGIARELAGSEVSRRFDRIGFDPSRGGHSTPGA